MGLLNDLSRISLLRRRLWNRVGLTSNMSGCAAIITFGKKLCKEVAERYKAIRSEKEHLQPLLALVEPTASLLRSLVPSTVSDEGERTLGRLFIRNFAVRWQGDLELRCMHLTCKMLCWPKTRPAERNRWPGLFMDGFLWLQFVVVRFPSDWKALFLVWKMILMAGLTSCIA